MVAVPSLNMSIEVSHYYKWKPSCFCVCCVSVEVLIEVINSLPLARCIRFNEIHVVIDMCGYSAFRDGVSVLDSYLFALSLEVFDVDARS